MSNATKAIKEAPTDVLCKAAKTLQESHDFVEEHEFDIGCYGNEKDASVCCYIGSVRQVSAERSIGARGPSRHEASEVALFALDVAALEMGAPLVDRENRNGGGIAEHWGFEGHDSSGDQKPIALGVYRQAIRELQTELMGRGDLAKAEKKVNKKVPVPA